MLIVGLKLVIGLVLLIFAADWLVKGASRLATRLGIPPLIVGLTVVAFGTSAPELAVSVQSAFSGNADIAMGNVIGSNIANVLLILGLSAIIAPLTVHAQLIRLDVPLMIGLSVLILLLGLDGVLGRGNGAILVACLAAYIGFLAWTAKRGASDAPSEFDAEFGDKPEGSVPLDIGLIVVGFAGLVVGANLLVSAAVAIATAMGVSQLVIGLTVVAIGTSLPEIATSLIAASKGERDIAVGNVVGSNLFNILAVLGISSLIAPSGIAVAEAARAFDLPVMIAVAVACLPVFARGSSIARWEGALFLFFYVAYTAYLVMSAQGSALLGSYETAMLWLVLPLTGVTLLVIGLAALRERGWLTARGR